MSIDSTLRRRLLAAATLWAATPASALSLDELTNTDAKNILRGGEDSVTKFFAEKSRAPLFDRFVPIVTQATETLGLARRYNRLAGQGESLGLVKSGEARLERHVTDKAPDGLYLMIGEEERKIRREGGSGSEILKRVFSGLK